MRAKDEEQFRIQMIEALLITNKGKLFTIGEVAKYINTSSSVVKLLLVNGKINSKYTSQIVRLQDKLDIEAQQVIEELNLLLEAIPNEYRYQDLANLVGISKHRMQAIFSKNKDKIATEYIKGYEIRKRIGEL